MPHRNVNSGIVAGPSAAALRQFICAEILAGRSDDSDVEPVTARWVRSFADAEKASAADDVPAVIEMTSMGLKLDFAPEGDLEVVELDEDDFEEIEETSYGDREEEREVVRLPPPVPRRMPSHGHGPH